MSERWLALLSASLLFCAGCSTAWQTEGSYYKTVQTQLILESAPRGKVSVNNRYVGETPVKTLVEYGQEVQRKTRKVSYWETQPGLSLFLTLVSLGLYLPFSAIPVDGETSLEPFDSFRNNVFDVQIEAEGYEKWQQQLLLKGEKITALQPTLQRRALK